tara:strand:+ start:384 stop:623 length:240 start_codon:yes stop_codon:yes gene_type:complete
MILTELTRGIFKLLKKLIGESSILLAVIYTIGHIFIATICNWLITGAAMELAAVDAIVEPLINGVWFYALHKFAKRFIK